MTVPADTPEMTPDADPAVAIAALLLIHVPPGVVLDNVIVCPAQIGDTPVMGVATAGDTITDWVAMQPEPSV